MWVRTVGHRWAPWLADDHGLEAEDHEILWAEMPVVGAMPQSWIDHMAQYEDEDEDAWS
jgi:hypothetical protein